jgi:broad specificity phosphatase PhoE
MRIDDATILLIRHGHTEAIGRRLVGRLPGWHLTAEGRAQAERLVETLRGQPIARIFSSPLERTRETAAPLARARGIDVADEDGLIEVEFGAWSGLTFEELARVPEWERFNTNRATAAVPGGEDAAAVQARIVATLERLAAAHRGETIAAVSHADVIRSAVLHYAGAPLDMVHRIEIGPASISAVALGAGEPRVLFVNHRPIGT